MSKLANQNDPKIDWGFHAVIPRLVRTEYKKITPPQKWAYVCLKDLCGETGTCYRTIRVLAEEIGLSAGMTSETIRVLHDEGLIHAEKKKRHTGGKEVWHITIVDIWAKNGQMHPTKRSPAEQECSPNEQTTRQQNVRCANVHLLNRKSPVCSPAEQECSPAETEEGSLSRINIEAGSTSTYSPRESQSADASFASAQPHALSEKADALGVDSFDSREGSTNYVGKQWPDGSVTPDYERPSEQLSTVQPTSPQSCAQPEQQNELVATPKQPAARRRGTPKVEQPSISPEPKPRKNAKVTSLAAPEFTPEGRKVFDAWCSLFKSPPRHAEKTVGCANDLYARLMPWCQELHIPCKDLLKEIKDWLYTTDPDWYRRKGVTLCDIGAKFEGWQSAKEYALSHPGQSEAVQPIQVKKTQKGTPYLLSWQDPTYDINDDFYNGHAQWENMGVKVDAAQ